VLYGGKVCRKSIGLFLDTLWVAVYHDNSQQLLGAVSGKAGQNVGFSTFPAR
jgi:hypothetical protein